MSPLVISTSFLVLLFSHLVKGQKFLQLEALKGEIRCFIPNSGPGVKLTLTKRLWTWWFVKGGTNLLPELCRSFQTNSSLLKGQQTINWGWSENGWIEETGSSQSATQPLQLDFWMPFCLDIPQACKASINRRCHVWSAGLPAKKAQKAMERVLFTHRLKSCLCPPHLLKSAHFLQRSCSGQPIV